MEEYGPRPFGYGDLEEKIKKIKGAKGPVKAFVMGKSVLGRSIYALGMGQLRQPALMVGATHGLESITSALLMMFAEELMEALGNRTQICGVDPRRVQESRGLIIVPMLNPDGVEIAQHGARGCLHLAKRIYDICDGHFERWQANARGVDLNHNFDAHWEDSRVIEGIEGPAYAHYPGPAPESEPETRALLALTEDYAPTVTLSYHSRGETIYWYFFQEGEALERDARLARRLLDLTGYAGLARGEDLTVTSFGGYKDYCVETLGIPAFTIETGASAWGIPVPIERFPEIYAQCKNLTALAAAP